LNARWLSASELYKWSLRRCSRAGEFGDAAALALPLLPLAAEDSLLKNGSLSGSTARHEAAALVEGCETVVMAGAACDRAREEKERGMPTQAEKC